MKKLSFFAMTLLLAATFTACEKVVGDGPMITEQRNVTNFSGIDLRMSGDVFFNQAAEYKVEVRAQDEIQRVLDTYVSNGKLVIKFENNVKVRLHDGVTINVSGPSLSSHALPCGSVWSNMPWPA